jgi:hypothetical protein
MSGISSDRLPNVEGLGVLALLAKSGPFGKVWPFWQSLALCQPVVPCHGLMAGREKVSVRGCRSYSPSDRMS